jgi:hypothetical protein
MQRLKPVDVVIAGGGFVGLTPAKRRKGMTAPIGAVFDDPSIENRGVPLRRLLRLEQPAPTSS